MVAPAVYGATTTVRTTWMTQKPFSSFWPLTQSAARAGPAATWALAPLNVLGNVATADDETTAYTAAPAMRPTAVPLRTEVR